MRGDAGISAQRGGCAVVDAELLVPAESVAVVVSSNFGNLGSVCEVVAAISADHGTRLISPVLAPRLSSNVTASELAIRFGLRGRSDGVQWSDLRSRRRALGDDLAVERPRRASSSVVGVEPANDVVRQLVGQDQPLDGAAALLLETTKAAAGRNAPALAGVDGYLRTGGLADCVSALAGSARAWFAPRNAPASTLAGAPGTISKTAGARPRARWGSFNAPPPSATSPSAGTVQLRRCPAARMPTTPSRGSSSQHRFTPLPGTR